MADTPTPKLTPANSPAGLALQAFKSTFEFPLAVAYSGGADSTALLLAAAQRWPGQVHAIHIHHGLQAAADDFVRVCQAVCASINVPLEVVRVDATHASGESPEDAVGVRAMRRWAMRRRACNLRACCSANMQMTRLKRCCWH